MKKRTHALYWIIFLVFAGSILLALSFYGKNKNQGNNSSNVYSPTIQSNSNAEDANANSSLGIDSGSSSKNQPDEQKASQESLKKFLTALTSGDKANIRNYSTSQFYSSDFVKGIINGTTSKPDAADIVSQGEKIGNSLIFQVKESYDIDKPNNAGVNGTYFYALVKSNSLWLVNYRGEEKPL